MISECYLNDVRYPICYDCGQPIIPNDEYYRIGSGSRTRFYHADCFHDDAQMEEISIQIMGEGGAE